MRLAPVVSTLAIVLSLAPLAGQQPAPPVAPPAQPSEITLTLSQEGGRRIALAVPPATAPASDIVQSELVDPFHKTLAGDLGISPWFVLADPALHPKGFRPPTTREEGDAWIASGAQFLLDTQIRSEGTNVIVSAQLLDLRTLRPILGKTYSAGGVSIRRVAHVIANDVVRQFTGKPGPFLTRIVFSSDRDGGRNKELYLMDYDGENQRRITFHRSLSLAPDWSYDADKIVYQSYVSTPPGLYWFSLGAPARTRIPVTTELNSAPSFSPDGRTVAYAGSVKGNPEIFVVGLDGSNPRRLTNSSAIDSSPRFSPNGREIAFTSNRQGSPQIYLMDTEGSNVRKLTLTGNWSDEPAFSPDGGRLAYACRNEGDFQICILDLTTGRTVQISSGPGANENPSWSPDGTRIAWELQRGRSTQIVSAGIDGSGFKVLTSAGNNGYPVWQRTIE
ncbi:MAG: PD40 domain-containing protein [Holophagales bacterium]|nr:PD40 domain-containing protein [Holophagales bacterium]